MELNLDLGSGGKAAAHLGPGWLGVDWFYQEADIHAVLWDLPYPDGSVNRLFTSHALEHIEKRQVPLCFREWYRVLKPGGSLSIRVPDLEWCCQHWLGHQTTGWDMDVIYGNQDHAGEFHRTGFSMEILLDYARHAGFTINSIERIFTHGQVTLNMVCSKSNLLALSHVSLIAVTSVLLESTIRSLQHCLHQASFKNAFIFTELPCSVPGIDRIPIPPLASIEQYSRFMLHDLPMYRAMFGTHALIVQHDGLIVSPAAWSDDFLAYDYVGAPWEDRAVGNGGFSLRSQRLFSALYQCRDKIVNVHPEDACLARTYRPLLESYGVQFAPLHIADRFAVENNRYSGSFGHHGNRTYGVALSYSCPDLETMYLELTRTPTDINEHLEMLCCLAKECHTVIEICSRSGESTAAFLQAAPKVLISINTSGDTLAPKFRDFALAAGIRFMYQQYGSFNALIELSALIEPTDFLFIDTEHNYESLLAELEQYAPQISKYIVLHDTGTSGQTDDIPGHEGIWLAVVDFLKTHTEWQLLRRHENNNGLTVLTRSS